MKQLLNGIFVNSSPVTDWSDVLVCPVCASELVLSQSEMPHPSKLACENGHQYDAARQGYFNLLTGKGTKFREDTQDMVAARLRFLEAGHYAPIAESVASAVPTDASLIYDAGSGPGYYLERVMNDLSSSDGTRAIAMDISRAAAKFAAKVPKTLALVSDVWSVLPVAAGSVDVVLNIFSPHNAEEFRRILRRGGRAIVVTPLPHHLQELRDAQLGLLTIQPEKQAKIHETFSEGYALIQEESLEFSLTLNPDEVADIVAMGPAGHHEPTSTETEQRTVSCGVVITVFEKK